MTKRAKFLLKVGGILLAVGVFGSLFLSILLVGLSNARRTAIRAKCASQLRELGYCVSIYAAHYKDALPVFGKPGGIWMCDQPSDWASVGALAVPAFPTMAFPASNYCPANSRQDPTVHWGGPAAPYRVTGYVWTNERPGMPSLAGLRPTPLLEYHRKFSLPYGEMELAVDWIISDKPTAAGASWTGITAPGRPGIYDTSHLAGQKPEGCNVLTFDGAVKWFSFDPAKSTPVPQTPAGPVFWFPGK